MTITTANTTSTPTTRGDQVQLPAADVALLAAHQLALEVAAGRVTALLAVRH